MGVILLHLVTGFIIWLFVIRFADKDGLAHPIFWALHILLWPLTLIYFVAWVVMTPIIWILFEIAKLIRK